MSDRRRLGVQDALWLEMDRPNNLMVVDSVIWTSQPLDWDRVSAVLQERLCDRFPVFRSVAVRDADGSWWWQEDEAFSFDERVTTVELDDPDDPRSLQRLAARHRTEMLDRDEPLWRALFVDRYREGSAIVLRTHHALADGMRMVQLSMSLFDAAAEGGAVLGPAVTQHAAQLAPPGLPATERVRAGLAGVGHQAVGSARFAVDTGHRVAGALVRAPEVVAGAVRLARAALTNPVGAGHGFVRSAQVGAGNAAASVRASIQSAVPGGGTLVDVFSAAPADVDVARKLLLGTRNDVALWTGKAGVEKAVAWSEPLSLLDVKAVAKAHHATVNDVLVTCAAGALHDYLLARDERCSSVTFMVPVNLKPLDLTLPAELGNSFALVQLELPTDQPDLLEVLAVAKRRMGRIKSGHEAALAFRLQEAIAGLSRGVYEASVDLLANRTIGTLTNVPGPPFPVYLAGCRVEGMVGWAPLSGDQPMSFTIYSYDGAVIVGIACDAQLVPDHEKIVDGFAATFARLQAQSGQAAT